MRGLKAIVLYLHSLPVNKKGVPAYIKDPVSLVRDIRIIVEVHKNDRPERAVNGRPLLFWPGIKQESSWFMKGKRTAEVDREPASRVENDGKMYLSKRIFFSFYFSVADPGCLSRIPDLIFFHLGSPDPNFFLPGSASKNLSILTQKNGF